MPKLVSDEGLEKNVLMGKGYSLVCFFDYCSVPCGQFRAEWNALVELLPNVSFYEIEVSENPGISKEIGILAIPTTILFRDGSVVVSYEGPYSKEYLVDCIKAEIRKTPNSRRRGRRDLP